ncbi:MAG: M50 family metallopeptidase [bacterium]
MSTVILFLVVIVVLVVIHELGHFVVAKLFGIRVDEFGIGYPPRALKLFVWKKTLFSLNWLPFGGFVKIFGEETDSETNEIVLNSFSYQAKWKRSAVVLAGIVANMLLAFVLYVISFSIGFLGTPSDFSGSVVVNKPEMLVTQVVNNSPASEAKIQAGDLITRISAGGKTLVPYTAGNVISFIQMNGLSPITFSIMHMHTVRDVVVTPREGVVDGKPGIGVGLSEVSLVRLPFSKAISYAAHYTLQECKSVFTGIGAMLASSVHGGKGGVLSEVSGPVGIAQIASQAYALGFGSFLSFVALISVNLAVVNMLPFPALDGGRLILELFTTDGKSRISKRVISLINQGGFILLILLMIYVTYHDIARLFS